jgi:hypothetical protein
MVGGMADTSGPRQLGGHHIRALARWAEHGTWIGVGVCQECQPGEVPPRRTFSVGQPCPECGAAGDLEWRWWPEPLLLPPAD